MLNDVTYPRSINTYNIYVFVSSEKESLFFWHNAFPHYNKGGTEQNVVAECAVELFSELKSDKSISSDE